MTETLADLIGKQVLGVMATYSEDTTDVYICGVFIRNDMQLSLWLPNGHSLAIGQRVTLHLDNRTGVSEYDADLKVYRLSYKATVTSTQGKYVQVEALEFEVYYGISVVLQYQAEDYHHAPDERASNPLPESPLFNAPEMDDNEQDNKVGVLITQGSGQPHTTVMAFLSSKNDDIFFITYPKTHKSKLLKRDQRCWFAIDNRATFAFEEAIEWNYSIVGGKAYDIAKDSPVFAQVRDLFIEKNPWEIGFFSNPDVEMFHLVPEHVVCPRNH